jgi:hypothetical protein
LSQKIKNQRSFAISVFRGDWMGAEGKQDTSILRIIIGIRNTGELKIGDGIVIIGYLISFEADSSSDGVEEFLTAR